MKGYLLLEDGTKFEGELFGKQEYTDGEVVFSTAMTGYEQSLTDPSFQGQILTFTYPMIGNYGIPNEEKDEYGLKKYFEGENISVNGVVVCEYSKGFSHYRGEKSFCDWLQEKNISGISGIDTRALTQHLRDFGSQKGQIVSATQESKPFDQVSDPNERNLVAEVSTTKIQVLSPANPIKKVAVFDFGVKTNILRSFLKRGIELVVLPWDSDITQVIEKEGHTFDGIFFSNGPGNPETIAPTVQKNVQYALDNNIPLWGICLGNQILALSIGGKTKKMKYGHRGMNQPCKNKDSGKCIITSQNHGYEVDGESLPEGWSTAWENLNDGSCEGIAHASLPAYSVQFHPEACPGPEDADFLFDEFISKL
jgi:carbamoyl-phosphate synthase small subunit